MVTKEDTSNQRFIELIEPIKELFYVYGLKNLNMDELSSKLGISKKTLYTFVKSKEDLVEKIFIFEESGWFRVSEEIQKQPINAIEKLLRISQTVHDEIKRFNPMMRFELKKYYDPIFMKYMERKRNYIYEGMKINMLQGIKEKLYRDDINIDLVATIYLNSFIEIHNSEVFKMLDIDFIQIFEVMFENHIRAISTSSGVAYFDARKKEILEYIKNN